MGGRGVILILELANKEEDYIGGGRVNYRMEGVNHLSYR